MLIVLSDLHFVDGTAGDHNLPVGAYKKAFELVGVDCKDIGKSIKDLRERGINEIHILFLGDIFDVTRSMRWFEAVDGESPLVRPWGTTTEIWDPGDERIRQKTRGILRPMVYPPSSEECRSSAYRGLEALHKVYAVCKFFRDLKGGINHADRSFQVKFQYVPGNHDRFMYVDQKAREWAAEALSLDQDPAQPFEHLVSSTPYRVVAFHGHETDLMNFGRDVDKCDAYEPEAWGEPSIGEAITIDVAVRIVHDLGRCIKALDSELWQKLESRVENMDNIRPVSALFTYLKELERYGTEYSRVLDEVVKELFDDFSADHFAFVRMWSGIIGTRHLKRLPWYFRLALAVIFAVGYRRRPLLHNLLDRIDKFAEGGFDGMVMESALGGETTPQQRIEDVFDGPFFKRHVLPLVARMSGDEPCHVVWGHTHHPEVLPVWNRSPRMMLFNTGTFRPRVLACGVPGDSYYVTQDTLSFAVFYRGGEIRTPTQGRGEFRKRYEHWQGVRWDLPG